MVTDEYFPRRVQRSRKRGVPLPADTKYVGRPTEFANPFDGRGFGHARAVRLYGRWIDGNLGDLSLEMLGFHPAEIDALRRLLARLHRRLPELSGLNLQCWCPITSRWCHADILLRRANPVFSPEEIA
ncbi:DUF4326 domain-containing protein [Sphingobium sp.]|uniref:DUF4326 domain-containing protein n=1 Tax=Sphingobium sp. TaxID=1912891 RepID=UPI003BB54F2A